MGNILRRLEKPSDGWKKRSKVGIAIQRRSYGEEKEQKGEKEAERG